MFFIEKEVELFESLITNNKIDLAENYNFTDLYNDEYSFYRLILYSTGWQIMLDNFIKIQF